MTEKMPKILIVEDNLLLRECLREMLEEDFNLTVIGEAKDGAEAIALAKRHRPDVILMDLELPVISGFEATREIVADHPESLIVATSMYHDAVVRSRALAAGAATFVVKDGPQEELVEAILRVYDEARVERARRSSLSVTRFR
jgi:DNA-binding NarL/FixJ family response regulator